MVLDAAFSADESPQNRFNDNYVGLGTLDLVRQKKLKNSGGECVMWNSRVSQMGLK